MEKNDVIYNKINNNNINKLKTNNILVYSIINSLKFKFIFLIFYFYFRQYGRHCISMYIWNANIMGIKTT